MTSKPPGLVENENYIRCGSRRVLRKSTMRRNFTIMADKYEYEKKKKEKQGSTLAITGRKALGHKNQHILSPGQYHQDVRGRSYIAKKTETLSQPASQS
ncbi:hypothetical protein Tco_0992573 [Tanacetum coccineum]|uniref:Uncharacterized protein n=1 Tax=Tanacetum coccineum TaxID=301880 RepID=A0ABQ5F3B2_9ASTR